MTIIPSPWQVLFSSLSNTLPDDFKDAQQASLLLQRGFTKEEWIHAARKWMEERSTSSSRQSTSSSRQSVSAPTESLLWKENLLCALQETAMRRVRSHGRADNEENLMSMPISLSFPTTKQVTLSAFSGFERKRKRSWGSDEAGKPSKQSAALSAESIAEQILTRTNLLVSSIERRSSVPLQKEEPSLGSPGVDTAQSQNRSRELIAREIQHAASTVLKDKFNNAETPGESFIPSPVFRSGWSGAHGSGGSAVEPGKIPIENAWVSTRHEGKDSPFQRLKQNVLKCISIHQQKVREIARQSPNAQKIIEESVPLLQAHGISGPSGCGKRTLLLEMGRSLGFQCFEFSACHDSDLYTRVNTVLLSESLQPLTHESESEKSSTSASAGAWILIHDFETGIHGSSKNQSRSGKGDSGEGHSLSSFTSFLLKLMTPSSKFTKNHVLWPVSMVFLVSVDLYQGKPGEQSPSSCLKRLHYRPERGANYSFKSPFPDWIREKVSKNWRGTTLQIVQACNFLAPVAKKLGQNHSLSSSQSGGSRRSSILALVQQCHGKLLQVVEMARQYTQGGLFETDVSKGDSDLLDLIAIGDMRRILNYLRFLAGTSSSLFCIWAFLRECAAATSQEQLLSVLGNFKESASSILGLASRKRKATPQRLGLGFPLQSRRPSVGVHPKWGGPSLDGNSSLREARTGEEADNFMKPLDQWKLLDSIFSLPRPSGSAKHPNLRVESNNNSNDPILAQIFRSKIRPKDTRTLHGAWNMFGESMHSVIENWAEEEKSDFSRVNGERISLECCCATLDCLSDTDLLESYSSTLLSISEHGDFWGTELPLLALGSCRHSLTSLRSSLEALKQGFSPSTSPSPSPPPIQSKTQTRKSGWKFPSANLIWKMKEMEDFWKANCVQPYEEIGDFAWSLSPTSFTEFWTEARAYLPWLYGTLEKGVSERVDPAIPRACLCVALRLVHGLGLPHPEQSVLEAELDAMAQVFQALRVFALCKEEEKRDPIGFGREQQRAKQSRDGVSSSLARDVVSSRRVEMKIGGKSLTITGETIIDLKVFVLFFPRICHYGSLSSQISAERDPRVALEFHQPEAEALGRMPETRNRNRESPERKRNPEPAVRDQLKLNELKKIGGLDFTSFVEAASTPRKPELEKRRENAVAGDSLSKVAPLQVTLTIDPAELMKVIEEVSRRMQAQQQIYTESLE